MSSGEGRMEGVVAEVGWKPVIESLIAMWILL